MARSQAVEAVYTDDRFYLSDFQRFAAMDGATITFKFGEELYHIDAHQLTLSYLAADSAPVDPLLAFKDVEGFPYIQRGDLKEMPGGVQGGEPPYFRVERFKGGVGQLQLYSWKTMVSEVSRTIGRDASDPPDTTLRGLLEYRGGVPPEYLEVASRSQQDGETFGEALIRLEFAQPRDLLFAALGGSRLFNPTCHMANAVGRALLVAGAIEEDDLGWAIEKQVATGKSLAAILYEHGACSGQAMSKALESLKAETIFLPPSDKMGEMLVKRGKLSRTQLMSAIFKLQGGSIPLSKHLVDEEMCTGQEIAEAEAWHDLKMRLRTAGKIRVGQLLLEDGAITKAALGKALTLQITRPDPLGEILMAEGLCSPEAVIAALLEQETRLNELVAAAVSGGDRKVVEDLDLFDVPRNTLKGQKAKKKPPPAKAAKAAASPKEEKTKRAGGKAAQSKGTRKLDPAKPRAKGTAKLTGAKSNAKGKAKGRKGTGKLSAKADRKPLPLKKIGLGVAAIAAFGVLAFGTISLVTMLSKPGAPKAPQVAASAAAPAAATATASEVSVAQGAFAGAQNQLAALDAAASGEVPAATAPPPAQDPAAPPQAPAAPPPAAGGTMGQQVAQQSQLTGDKTSLSHLSNDELKRIAKKNPAFVTADDVEAKGGRVGEVLTKLEKTDPQFAKAVAAARKTSGADILNKELENLENDAPGQLEVKDNSGGPGGPASAQAQAGAATSFRSAQGDAPPSSSQAGAGSKQFSQAAAGDMAPAAIPDARKQVGAFANNSGQGAQLGAPQREAKLQEILDENQLKTQLQKNPKDAGAANGMGLVLLEKGQPAQAEQVLRKAQAAKPADPVLNQNLAAALMAQKKDAAAVPLLRKSQAAFKARTGAELKQAQAAFARKDLKTAESKIRAAMRSQTLAADASARLGTALSRQGKAAEARIHLRQAAETYMTVGRVHVQLGEVYAQRGNHKMAIYEYKLAAKLDPRAGRPWYLLGKEAAALKKPALARKYYTTALKKEPKAAWAKDARSAVGAGQPRKVARARPRR